MIAYQDVAEYRGARADHDVIAKRRMPLALLLASAAQRHSLVKQHVVADLSRFPDHDAGAMVYEEPPPDGRARMNFDAGQEAAELGDQARQQGHTPAVQAMGQAVQQDGMQTRITEQNFRHALGGRIPLEGRMNLLSDLSEHASTSMIQELKGRTMMVCNPTGQVQKVQIATGLKSARKAGPGTARSQTA